MKEPAPPTIRHPSARKDTAGVLGWVRRWFGLAAIAVGTTLLLCAIFADMLASDLPIACNIHGIPKTPLEITAYTEINTVQLISTHKKIKKTLDIKTKPINPIDILPRFASRLGLTPQTITLTAEIINKIRETGKFEGRKPETILAGAIYLAGIQSKDPRTQRQISYAIGLTEVTIRKITKEMFAKIL